MKVLQINCVYGKGSTGMITESLHKSLTETGIESYVIYGRGEITKDIGVVKTGKELQAKAANLLSRFSGILYGGCGFQTRRLISEIDIIKPDVVHLQCINGFFVNIYKLLDYLGKRKIPTVITLHAEFLYTGTCGYSLDCDCWKENTGCRNCAQWLEESKSLIGDRTPKAWKLMRDAFNKMDKTNTVIVSVSPWLQSRAQQSAILKDFRHTTVFNGIDTGVFRSSEESNRGDRLSILYVTPYFSDNPEHIKGGYYLLKLAELMPEARFFVAGKHEENVKLPENVTLLGEITNRTQLAKYYSEADVTVVTSRRETFSMPVAESLCCGTPVAGFLAGAPETIAVSGYSRFVPYGDIFALKEAIMDLRGIKASKQIIEEAAQARYGRNVMAENYIKIYRELLERKNA